MTRKPTTRLTNSFFGQVVVIVVGHNRYQPDTNG